MSRAKITIVAIAGMLALGGFTSTLASAAPAGWMVQTAALTKVQAIEAPAVVDSNGFVITAGQAQIVCKATVLGMTEPVINGVTNMLDASSLKFQECEGNQICPLGLLQGKAIQTLPVLADLTLQGLLADKGHFLSTNTSHTFATIEFGGAECPFAGVNILKGSQGFLMPTGQDERDQQLFTTETLVANELVMSGTPASISGSFLVHLPLNLPFSFL